MGRITLPQLAALGRTDGEVLAGMLAPIVKRRRGLISDAIVERFIEAATALNNATLADLRAVGLTDEEIAVYTTASRLRLDECLGDLFGRFIRKSKCRRSNQSAA